MTHEPQHPEYDDGYEQQSKNQSDHPSDRGRDEDYGPTEGADRHENGIGLVQEDAQALDALIEANYQIEAVPTPL